MVRDFSLLAVPCNYRDWHHDGPNRDCINTSPCICGLRDVRSKIEQNTSTGTGTGRLPDCRRYRVQLLVRRVTNYVAWPWVSRGQLARALNDIRTRSCQQIAARVVRLIFAQHRRGFVTAVGVLVVVVMVIVIQPLSREISITKHGRLLAKHTCRQTRHFIPNAGRR